jgi:hypothetical protein
MPSRGLTAFYRAFESRRLALTERQKHLEEAVEEVLANPLEYITLWLDLLGIRLQVILIVAVGLFIFLLLDAMSMPTEVITFVRDRLPPQIPSWFISPSAVVIGLVIYVGKVTVGFGVVFALLGYNRRFYRARAILREVRTRKKKQSVK